MCGIQTPPCSALRKATPYGVLSTVDNNLKYKIMLPVKCCVWFSPVDGRNALVPYLVASLVTLPELRYAIVKGIRRPAGDS